MTERTTTAMPAARRLSPAEIEARARALRAEAAAELIRAATRGLSAAAHRAGAMLRGAGRRVARRLHRHQPASA